MPSFRYIAYNNQGVKKSGLIEAEAKQKAVLLLKNKGLYPESLERIEKKEDRFLNKIWVRYFCRVSQSQRAELFFRLATLLESAIPLVEALNIVATQSRGLLKDVLLDIKDKVNEGMRFSAALETYPRIFYPIYINMIAIAERTGNLSQILFKIAHYEEEKGNLSQRLITTLIYPVFVISLGSGVVSFLLIYVVPKMQKIFASLHKELPSITRLMIKMAIFLHHYFLYLMGLILAFFLLIRLMYAYLRGFRTWIEKAFLSLSIYKKFLIARFTSVLGFQLEAGIPLIEAMMQARLVVKNSIFHKQIETAAGKIKDGTPLDLSFQQIGLFDHMFIASLNTGQKTGKLGEFVKRTAVYYERELDKLLKQLLALSEPISILILGLIVGFIVMSIMVPLFDINQLVR